MELKITPSGQTIVKPTALGLGANTNTKLLIYGLFQKGRVLAQDAIGKATATMALEKIATAEDVANAIVFFSSSALAGHLSGSILPIAGGMEGRWLHP